MVYTIARGKIAVLPCSKRPGRSLVWFAVCVVFLFCSAILPGCGSEDESAALEAAAKAEAYRSALVNTMQLAYAVVRLAAVHLDPDDDYCGKLLWELDGAVIEIYSTQQELAELHSAIWLDWLGEEWSAFPGHHETLELYFETSATLDGLVSHLESRGNGRCWPPSRK